MKDAVFMDIPERYKSIAQATAKNELVNRNYNRREKVKRNFTDAVRH